MPVLTIASSKGGPGKTTVAMLLAGALAAEGGKVLALDADPTQALSRWIANAYEGLPIETIAEVDEAMTSADAIIVPSLAGEADVTEAEKTIRLAGGLARAARRDIPARVLLNRVKRTQLSRHAAQELASAGLPRIETTLSDLVVYGELSYSGRIPTSGMAAVELAALVAELRSLGWLPARQAGATTSLRNDVTRRP